MINALANPRPTLETYSYAMPGEANMPQSQLEIFDVAIEGQTDLLKSTPSKIRPSRLRWTVRRRGEREHEKTEIAVGARQAATSSISRA